jgi:soluble lytic murein transglycosylase
LSPPPDTKTRSRTRPWALSEIREAASRRTRREPKLSRKFRKRRWPSRRTIAIGGAAAGVAALVAFTNAEQVTTTIREQIERGIEEVTLPLRHDDIIRQQAREKGVDADLIAAIIYSESRFRDQTSDAGARGLMQITPQTADYVEKRSGGQTFEYDDLADPDLNIRYGTFYVQDLLKRYDGNEVAAIAGYNAGPTAVDQWGGAEMSESDIQFPETVEYVDEVIDKREDYRDNYAEELGL